MIYSQILCLNFYFLFSYSLLIILNKSGLFNIIPSRDDENRAEFFNRAHCFKYLNRLNPSFYYVLNLTFLLNGLPLICSLHYTMNINFETEFYGYDIA